MKNVIEMLKRYFNTAKNTGRNREFILGVVDYIDFIKNTPQLTEIINTLIEESKNKLLKEIGDLELKSFKELKLSREKLLKEIEKTEFIKIPAVSRMLEEIKEAYDNKKLISPITIYEYLMDIAKNIAKKGRKDLIKDFIKETEVGERPIFSETFEKMMELRLRFINLRKNELWGACDYIMCIYKYASGKKVFNDLVSKIPLGMVYRVLPIYSEIVEELKFSWGEIVEIKSHIFEKQANEINPKLREYQHHLVRIHNYLLEKLDKQIKQQPLSDLMPTKAEYDNNILYFCGKEIDFRNKQNQKDLLATLFEEPSKNWSYDEIQGKWDELKKTNLIKYPKNYWKKFYSAGDDINKAVAIETQTKDFLIKNTKEIRVNPKYL